MKVEGGKWELSGEVIKIKYLILFVKEYVQSLFIIYFLKYLKIFSI